MGGLVNEGQANGMGGAGKPAGAQADNTFQDNKVRQIVFLVRYKPAPAADTAGASSMLGGITGAIEGAVGAVESVMDSIPGLNMFIKEDKSKSPSEKEYTYFNDYAAWDGAFSRLDKELKELFPENKTEIFEFTATDSAGRKADAAKLLSKLKSKLGAWSQYTAKIHFIGLGQGGNVVNECTDLLAKDAQFGSEKWFVRSVIYVATPLYAAAHLLNKGAFKGAGGSFSFGSKYDLTQQAIGYFEGDEKLRKLIEDANKNTLSLMVGRIKLHIINALAILLSGMSLGTGDQSDLDKPGKIRDEIEAILKDTIDLIKKIIDEGASFVKLGDLPEFAKIMNGYGDIPGKAGALIQKAISDLGDSVANQLKSTNVSLSPKDLGGLLTCLCPLFDTISDSLSVFKYGSSTASDLAKQVIESAGVTNVYAPAGEASVNLDVDPAYEAKAQQANADGKPQMAGALVSTVNRLLAKATANNTEVSKMNDEEKTALAEAISAMAQPMLATKKKLYQELLKLLPFDLSTMMSEYTADKLMDVPGKALSGLNIEFPDALKTSIARADAEIKRIRSYFEKTDCTLPEDTLYFIYNQHNLALKKMWEPIAACVQQQTGYADFIKSKGKPGEEKPAVLPAVELPAAT